MLFGANIENSQDCNLPDMWLVRTKKIIRRVWGVDNRWIRGEYIYLMQCYSKVWLKWDFKFDPKQQNLSSPGVILAWCSPLDELVLWRLNYYIIVWHCWKECTFTGVPWCNFEVFVLFFTGVFPFSAIDFYSTTFQGREGNTLFNALHPFDNLNY